MIYRDPRFWLRLLGIFVVMVAFLIVGVGTPWVSALLTGVVVVGILAVILPLIGGPGRRIGS